MPGTENDLRAEVAALAGVVSGLRDEITLLRGGQHHCCLHPVTALTSTVTPGTATQPWAPRVWPGLPPNSTTTYPQNYDGNTGCTTAVTGTLTVN